MRYVKFVIRFLILGALGVVAPPMSLFAQNSVGSASPAAVADQGSGAQSAPVVSGQGDAGASTPESRSVNISGGQSQQENPLRKGNPTDIIAPMRIAPGDDLEISVFEVPELTQHARVSNSGDISLPLIGMLHVAGLSGEEAQATIEKHLADGNYVNDPHVSLYVKEYTTEGITLVGEVNKPGVYSVLAGHRLLDLIQTAGGLTPRAGKTARITHRDDPNHPITVSVANDPDVGKTNIELWPGDTVVIAKAGIVYVVGEVNRPGGFVIEGDEITASQAIAWAAGPTHTAALNGAKMIRRTPQGLKDTTLALKNILSAKAPDVQLQADDIIWVPASKTKGITNAGATSVLGMLTSLAIYRF